MITVGMNYKVIPGKGETFEKAFDAVLKAMAEMPAHRQSNLYRDVHDGNSYLIISEWDDKDAFDAFIKSEQFRRVADWGKEQILAGRPSHDIYQR
jgi:heme-degrading monooxygenase HmoA